MMGMAVGTPTGAENEEKMLVIDKTSNTKSYFLLFLSVIVLMVAIWYGKEGGANKVNEEAKFAEQMANMLISN